MVRGFRHTLFLLLEVGVVLSGGVALIVRPDAWPAIAICVSGSLLAALGCERMARAYLRRTLGRLRRAAEEAGQGRQVESLAAEPGHDFYKLVNSINGVAQRLSVAAQEQQRLHEQIRRSEKLAFLGELAATVAHEVNNPLDGIANCSRILRRSLDDPARARQMLDLIDSGLERIEVITRRLLTLAREHSIKATRTRLRTVVAAAVESVKARLEGLGVRVGMSVEEAEDWIAADAALLEQVFVNLFINAADAMPEGGEIAVRIGRPADRSSERNGPLTVEVSDDGAGIPSEALPRIFEPFFTTKKDGKGTGLGLAIAARIVDAHQGRIDVRGREPRGTVFTVLLPPAQKMVGGSLE